ncbi:pyruvate carboxylase [Serendipita sp. 400]|nr:pyruvate carboxylase [Serendipita sp. 400]
MSQRPPVEQQSLFPPRLASHFAPGTPSAPGTPVHSIQTIRRKAAGHHGPLTKILVANRGEIAIRVFRTSHELAMHTVAIYSYEDRMSAHRQKADEAYQVGKGLTPVAAYLAQDDIISIALEHGVDMIHPGYGFLSENAEFAKKVEQAGLAFVGPSPEVIDALGDKTKARSIAIKIGVPVVPGTPGPVGSYEDGASFIEEHGFPVIIKAAMGGGGRGMRVVREDSEFKDAFSRAVSEAKSAFGDGTVFIERFLDKPRHIEVQILADGQGNCVHLFERDCSVQRRHQKVVEVAPATHLPEDVRQAILSDALKLAESVGYRNAGTAEFLVDQMGRHYFIEINPRIQVEHTITVKVTVSGTTYEVARRKMLRALVEFRIRGVKTNIPFLFRLLTHDVFIAGKTWTTFIDDTPDLFKLVQTQNRAQKLLAYLGDLAVNGSGIKGQVGEPGLKTDVVIPKLQDRTNPDTGPPLDCSLPCEIGWRNIIVKQGPEAFAKAVRQYPGTLIMDTTWRDAHQSLLATRLRTIDMVNIAKETSYALANAYSLECWGGATFDVSMRFLYEDPWERLRTLRKLVPNIPFQALVRGANAVGYTSYADNVIYDFCKKAVENGLDIFRVFDSLNYIENVSQYSFRFICILI